MLTKDDESIISVNRMKSTSKVSTREDCIKFIHKKNQNKGKIQSIQLKGPYKSNNLLKWVVYYELPLNKNHLNTEWQLVCPDGGVLKVYNGAVLIYTKETSESNDTFPLILDTDDIDIQSSLDWKVKKSIDICNLNSKEEMAEEDEDGDEGEENVNVLDNSDDEEELIDDTFDIPNNGNINIETNVIELKDDLKTKTTNLSYEKYDYDSDIIPLHPMKEKIKPVHC
tara:strand:+ start:514 stop:1191 length:678 start_codon:yes stop_codon:yes gene_type:complete